LTDGRGQPDPTLTHGGVTPARRASLRGRLLTSHEVVVSCIGATRTRTGLSIRAELDPGAYPTGVTVPDHVVQRLPEYSSRRS